MGTVELFTIGGCEYIVNVLNAVAAWTGAGGYKSLLQVVLVMGLAYSVLIVAFSLDWRAWLHWFCQATLMYMVLMVPRLDVHVTDRINPSLAPAQVANVPLGLAMIASFTSQVGDYLVRSSEVVFGLPGDLDYSRNGMIYGSRLFEAHDRFASTIPSSPPTWTSISGSACSMTCCSGATQWRRSPMPPTSGARSGRAARRGHSGS